MNVIVRDYGFSDAHLVRVCTKAVQCVTRDLVDFGSFGGLMPATIQLFQTQYEDFEALPSDEFYEGSKMVRTEQKDILRRSLNIKLSEVMHFEN